MSDPYHAEHRPGYGGMTCRSAAVPSVTDEDFRVAFAELRRLKPLRGQRDTDRLETKSMIGG